MNAVVDPSVLHNLPERGGGLKVAMTPIRGTVVRMLLCDERSLASGVRIGE